ncbi:MAG TPA: SRPBCC family protein [Acidimicrobiia bacterium]
MRIRVSTVIAASPAEVWDAIDDISTHTEWMRDAESIEFLTHRTRGVDTTFVCVTRIGPFRTRDVLTITEWSPRRVMGIAHEGVVKGSGRFTLARRRGGHTKFTWRERLRFPWWMGGPIGALAAKPILRHVWKANLRALRTRIEGNATL